MDDRIVFDGVSKFYDEVLGVNRVDLSIGPGLTGLVGPNGSGKSTLISHIVQRVDLGEDKLIYIPQEIDGQSSRQIISSAKRLPGDQLGRVMAIVSHLNSRPERLLESHDLSPGEIRKLLLATGITHDPYLIIMDEPTNHMDLPSIECLEAALSECPCGMLLVSHDRLFLDKLTDRTWHISGSKERDGGFVLGEGF